MVKRKAEMSEEPERKKVRKERDGESPAAVGLDDAGGLKERPKNETYMKRKNQQRIAMQRPKVFLKAQYLGGDNTENKAPEVFVRDVQYLIVYGLRRGVACDQPRWCTLLRPCKMSCAVLIVLNDVSMNDFQQHSDCFPFLQGTIHPKLKVAVRNPCQYFSTFDFDMYAVPITKRQLKSFKREHGSTSHRNGIQVVFPSPQVAENLQKPAAVNMDKNDRENGRKTVTKKQLILSLQQMVEENYPLPGEQDKKYEDFVSSKKRYAPVTTKSPIFAVDCEMCLTSALRYELTRVSIVNEKGEVIYDELVKPWNSIYNYLTKYSGITKKMLDPVTKRLHHVQKEISTLLPNDAILCGQSLGNDLCALKMFHPYVIDTSVIYNLSGNRKVKCSLKRLAYTFLRHVIQESKSGHCSAEDAKATMDLVQLKLSKTITFGDAVLGGDVSSFLPGGDAASLPPNADAASVPPNADAASAPPDEDVVSSQPSQPPSGVHGFGPEPVNMRSLFDILNEKRVSGENIAKLITDELAASEIPWENCLALGADNAYVMTGGTKGVFAFLKKEHASLYMAGCVCHLMHICAEKACQVGRERLVSKYQEEPDLKCCQVSSDQEACVKVEELSGSHKFTWVEFSAFADLLADKEQKENSGKEQSESDQDAEEKKRVLKTMDGQIQRVVEQLREKSLVVVALTGRSTQQHHEDGAVLLHIT